MDHYYKKASCETLTRVGSNHYPNIVNTDDHRFQQQHGFRFEMAWLSQGGFREQVVASWPERGEGKIQDFWREMKAYTRRFCKGWGANTNSQIKNKKKDLLGKLKNLDSEMESNGLNVLQRQQRYEWENELEGIYQFEAIQWQRRGGVKWILEGDSNSRYFQANGRKKKCTIFALEDGERSIRDPKDIRDHVESYYKSLFGKEKMGSITLGENFWNDRGRLSNEEAQELIRPFTIKEIEDTLRDMEVNSAPGPDGLPVGFYREFWTELKPFVLEIFNDFFKGELNISRLNYGMISLIPKTKEANNIKQYRPTCRLNVDYKWFTKTLTLRLTPWAAKLISETQTTFIPGRYILEGVVILHEVLHELRVSNLRGIILKLDFEKPYDKVQWGFMMEVLRRKNFPPKWLEWMKQIIEGGRVAININGEDGQFFNTHKGLRQGDPLSPLMFNLVSDTLATMFENAKLTGQTRGLVPNLIEGGLTHLQYADDTIVFLNHDDQSIYNTKFLLYYFEDMSGLKINYEKSEVFVLGCFDEEQKRVAEMFNCNNGSLPLKYLGIMVNNKHMPASDLSYVHLKVEK
jgi:hypothetical protein